MLLLEFILTTVFHKEYKQCLKLLMDHDFKNIDSDVRSQSNRGNICWYVTESFHLSADKGKLTECCTRHSIARRPLKKILGW